MIAFIVYIFCYIIDIALIIKLLYTGKLSYIVYWVLRYIGCCTLIYWSGLGTSGIPVI